MQIPEVMRAHSERSEILRSLEPLFAEAQQTGKWFYCNYQGLWFSPAELKTEHGRGKFVWGVENWTLRDPKERLDELEVAIMKATNERHHFMNRMAKES